MSRCWPVGSCVRPGENFFPLAYDHVCTRGTLTGNLAVNGVFITMRSMRDKKKFHYFSFFETLYILFPLPWWSNDLLVENLQGRAVNFEIHLCSSGVNSDLGECFFWGLCKLVIASTDLWPQHLEMFTFLELLAMVVSESSFIAHVYHRGLHRHQRLLSGTGDSHVFSFFSFARKSLAAALWVYSEKPAQPYACSPVSRDNMKLQAGYQP